MREKHHKHVKANKIFLKKKANWGIIKFGAAKDERQKLFSGLEAKSFKKNSEKKKKKKREDPLAVCLKLFG